MGNKNFKGGQKCCNRKDIQNRRQKPYVSDSDVILDIEQHIKEVCEISPNSNSCNVAKMHYEDMLKSPKGKLNTIEDGYMNSSDSESDIDKPSILFDVYTSECPCVQSVEDAIQSNKTGLCSPVKESTVMKFVTKMVNEEEKNTGKEIEEKSISEDKILNKAAEVTNCDDKECVLSAVVRKYNINTCSNNTPLKPSGPRDNIEWLSNNNIDQIMEGITNEFDDFYYFQTTMTDFQNDKLKSFLDISSDRDLKDANKIIPQKMNDKYNCFGCIINTDKVANCKRGKCGVHWVCVFIDCRKLPDSPWTIEYFDSVGDPPSDEICIWQEELKKNLEEYRFKKGESGGVICEVNDIQHQKLNTECGVYCSYFIRSRVEGIPLSRFKNIKLPDYVMISYRRHLFSK